MVFAHLQRKKLDTTIHTLLKMSRLPLKDPKTFDNFDFSVIKGRDAKSLKTLPSLSAIYAHRNLAFIGPAGTGKTHLLEFRSITKRTGFRSRGKPILREKACYFPKIVKNGITTRRKCPKQLRRGGYFRKYQAGNRKRNWFWFGRFGLNQSRMPVWACRSSSEIPSAIL